MDVGWYVDCVEDYVSAFAEGSPVVAMKHDSAKVSVPANANAAMPTTVWLRFDDEQSYVVLMMSEPRGNEFPCVRFTLPVEWKFGTP